MANAIQPVKVFPAAIVVPRTYLMMASPYQEAYLSLSTNWNRQQLSAIYFMMQSLRV